MIDDLLRMIGDNTHPIEVFGFSIATDDPKLYTPRKRLATYSQYLLITLHHAAKTPSHRYNAFYMFANEDRDEGFINTYCLLADNEEKLFDADWGYVSTIETAVHSLGLYPELDRRNRRYEDQAIALTGVVTTIQRKFPNTESQYGHKDAKLLRYVPMADAYGDPDTADEGDTVVRLANDELAQLVIERPDEWERIARIVVEREADDVEVIRSVLDAKVSSLSNGTL